MQSTFSGIELGKRGLVSHTQGLSTVGHNLSNASTEGYSRQRVQLKPTDPLYVPGLSREETPGQIGQGTDIARIERIRDDLLEGRIVSQAHGETYWQTRDKYLLMVEKSTTSRWMSPFDPIWIASGVPGRNFPSILRRWLPEWLCWSGGKPLIDADPYPLPFPPARPGP